MLEQLFPALEVVAPYSNTFSVAGPVGLYRNLVVELVEPAIEFILDLRCGAILFFIKDLEPWIGLGAALIEQDSLLQFALLQREFLGGTDEGDSGFLLDKVPCSCNDGAFRPDDAEVYGILICLCKIPEFFQNLNQE